MCVSVRGSVCKGVMYVGGLCTWSCRSQHHAMSKDADEDLIHVPRISRVSGIGGVNGASKILRIRRAYRVAHTHIHTHTHTYTLTHKNTQTVTG
jgi:hypothetical protein